MPKRVTMNDPGTMKLGPLAGRDPHADALADEIIAEAGNRRIGDHAAIFDLRIDQTNGAELRAALAELLAVDPHRIAHLKKTGMPLRHAQPQNEILFCHGGDGFTGQDDRASRHRHLQNAAGGRRKHIAFGDLLLDHRAFGGARLQRIGRNIEGGARLIEAGFRNGAAREQIFARE